MTDQTDLLARADAAQSALRSAVSRNQASDAIAELGGLVPELRNALAAERARVAALEAENARLREALKHSNNAYDCGDVVSSALTEENNK